MRKVPVEAILPLALSAVAVVGVLPFAFIRIANGDWTMAGIDTIIIMGFAFLGFSVLRPRRVRFASIAIAIFCVVGVLTTVYIRGEEQIFWAYPALLATFYLAKPGEAVLISTLTIIALVPALVPQMDGIILTTTFVTLIATSVFAYAFAFLSRGQRDQLLQRFRDAGDAILLGTDSFWEGVDVPGRALRSLVLAKLPFKVPSEPITAARLERLAEQGEDGFFGYLLPHAALKLKQGFGRLIRGATDVGVVVLLDSRVVTRRYGPMLLDGLPPAERVIGPWRTVRSKCEDFFARHGIVALP